MRSFPRETALYLLALLIGLAVRLIGLGGLPLTDTEARWALQALEVANGARPVLGSQPAYIVLTSALFFTFGGATNALARLIPALTGSALILVPALFKERLKPRPALIMAFAVALEPGITAISRQVGSPIMAITFVLLAWGLWEKRVFRWSGICAGMALLSGSALWVGLLGFAIAWAILRPFEHEAVASSMPPRNAWRTASGYALGAIVGVGSLLLLAPSGLSAWAAGLPEYISGWTQASGIPGGMLLFSLLAYQPLGILLALIATVRGWIQRSFRVRRLSLWMLVALLLALFYPSHQATDLAWMLVPLWALASLEAARNLNVRPHDRREVLGAVALSFIILVFIWLNFLQLIRPMIPPGQITARIWLLLGSLFLLVVSLLLVAVGWSIRAAQYGAVWGIAAFLGVYSFAALMGAAGLRSLPEGVEMWRTGPRPVDAALLLNTVRDSSAWSDRDVNAQPVTIAGLDSPALLWLLRDRNVESQTVPHAAARSPMVITPLQEDPGLASAYRGQDFVWRRLPSWNLTGLSQWMQWLPFHQIPQETETIILWVRNDLFPDARPEP
jgi:4-amino-4-deoxy-L-arabinose transferase-like glycosyltransferase